jgi:hypothetical protein
LLLLLLSLLLLLPLLLPLLLLLLLLLLRLLLSPLLLLLRLLSLLLRLLSLLRLSLSVVWWPCARTVEASATVRPNESEQVAMPAHSFIFRLYIFIAHLRAWPIVGECALQAAGRIGGKA